MQVVQINVDKFLQQRKRIPTKKVLEMQGYKFTAVLMDGVPMIIERLLNPYEAFKLGVEVSHYIR